MISILVPSRGRPDQLQRMVNSVYETANDCEDLEIITYLDVDDPQIDAYKQVTDIHVIQGPRIVLSEAWNKCWEQAKGNIFMHAGDDIIFRTKDWDALVVHEFATYFDHIMFVHGNDGGPNGDWLGTHGFLHKAWTDTLGYFVPPYFASDYNDLWLNDIANMLGRRRYIDILTEHMHPAFDKGEWDQTHQERIERHHSENVDQIWRDTWPQRFQDAKELEKMMT